jgi:ribonuclease HII
MYRLVQVRLWCSLAPDSSHEKALLAQGYQHIAGIDEAGRGCWAGPVVAAAVVLPPALLQQPALPEGIDDSKVLTSTRRDAGYDRLTTMATGIGVGVVPAYLIDTLGIVAATRLAMTVALLSLPCRTDALLIDAMTLGALRLPQVALIKGDTRSLSIASASIVAKVTRDRLMCSADAAYPCYGFAAHKGYGTARHRQALHTYGVSPLHRLSFRPVAAQQEHPPAAGSSLKPC